MSETVYYKGTAIEIKPKGKTLNDVAENILKNQNKEIPSYYSNAIECLCDEYYNEYFFHEKTQKLYKLDTDGYEDDGDIIRASKNEDESISFELRFYNGGASFDECLEEAFDNLYI
jgi:hypothetical protein